jgi:hypothetical protein
VTCTFTFQATPTKTNTSTVTLTCTPTIPLEPVVWPPFPNPANSSPISIPIQVPGPSVVTMDVFTLAFRKVASQTTQMDGSQTLQWNLEDVSGDRVANGLYYIRIHVTGIQSTAKILKVLVLR